MSTDSGLHDIEPSFRAAPFSSNGRMGSLGEIKTTPKATRRKIVRSRRAPNQRATKSQKQPSPSLKKLSSPRIDTPTDEESVEDCHRNGDEVQLQVTGDCPDEERFLFEVHWKYRHNKGQMWEKIQKE